MRAIVAMWKGELPLGRAFWLWGVLGGTSVSLASTLAAAMLLAADAPAGLAALALSHPGDSRHPSGRGPGLGQVARGAPLGHRRRTRFSVLGGLVSGGRNVDPAPAQDQPAAAVGPQVPQAIGIPSRRSFSPAGSRGLRACRCPKARRPASPARPTANAAVTLASRESLRLLYRLAAKARPLEAGALDQEGTCRRGTWDDHGRDLRPSAGMPRPRAHGTPRPGGSPRWRSCSTTRSWPCSGAPTGSTRTGCARRCVPGRRVPAARAASLLDAVPTPRPPGSSQTVRKPACFRHLRADLPHMRRYHRPAAGRRILAGLDWLDVLVGSGLAWHEPC